MKSAFRAVEITADVLALLRVIAGELAVFPAHGEVIEINEELGSAPEKINENPYGDGWMIRIRMINKEETADLMSAEEYDEYTKEEV